MFFRNIFLSAHALKPVGLRAMQSRGFVPPLGCGACVQLVGHDLWPSLGGEDRILPSAAVHRQWQTKIDELMARFTLLGAEFARFHTMFARAFGVSAKAA